MFGSVEGCLHFESLRETEPRSLASPEIEGPRLPTVRATIQGPLISGNQNDTNRYVTTFVWDWGGGRTFSYLARIMTCHSKFTATLHLDPTKCGSNPSRSEQETQAESHQHCNDVEEEKKGLATNTTRQTYEVNSPWLFAPDDVSGNNFEGKGIPNLHPPPMMDFTVPTSWEAWKRRFKRYISVHGHRTKSESDKAEEIWAQFQPTYATISNAIHDFEDSTGETVTNFITALHGLAERCDYGTLKQELICDRIVVGISDVKTSEQLQLLPELTLEL
ncbi:hypothetical protein PR048_018603 [Dryococelus australis]|uniref:Uncharacterized protein n=1 Tax=Dryococelus australis TaxID=614101 RepID=A0ABQ9HD02_9NEOP|nr:hypothetical protein PR048_018603 [Dryococelus australis]